MTGPAVVIKLGGRALEAPGAEAELAAALAAAPFPTVLVHGGGRDVSDWCARLGIEPRFHGGLRVTDSPTLEVAAAVLAGLANKRLVAALRAGGIDAVGLAAADGGIVDVEPHPERSRLGAVGCARSVEPTLLRLLIERGFTPVLSSIAAHDGALLNVNADEVAGAVAAALGARALVLLSDVEGVMLDGARVPTISAAQVAELLGHADVKDGMIPKLEAARRAVEGGARRAVIGAWQGAHTLEALIADAGPATVVFPTSAPEGTHV